MTAVFGGADCEQIGTGWLAQPVNALSSLAFVPAGAWVASRAGEGRGWRRWETLGVGAALVANGVGSFAYHGTQPRWAEVAHDAPIVVLVALLAANEVGRRAQPLPHTEPERQRRRVGRVALATGAAALVAYALGRTESPLCRPGSLLQWHAAWHGLAAVSLAAAAAARIERG